MNIKELQKKIKEADELRGWEASFLSQTFTHLVEEIGEIGRHILYIEGYKSSAIAKEIDNEEFGKELVDAIIFILKIANSQRIDLEKIIKKKTSINWEERFPINECLKDSKDYLGRQQKILDNFKKLLDKK